ncbi:MAG: thiamine-phosphate pyrophosphorylase [Candidatus Binataceae bacterium]|jgi:thiamine-phosphate pyrophosphorylase|nr:thiamine-phosphate pyrophosphorylase [Candidatus Binataceae bacterium]
MKLPSRFYAMVDTAGGQDPAALARMLLEAGARIMQLRLKEAGSRDFLATAREIAGLCRSHGAMLIVNDRADIARLADAAGVHVGQDDLPLADARAIMGTGSIVGVSTHSVEQARAAAAGGADYIGFGAIYTGGLKNAAKAQGLERLRAVRGAVGLPIVAIGGITETTMPEVLAAGADAAAIITDVVRSSDIPAKVRALLAIEPPSNA